MKKHKVINVFLIILLLMSTFMPPFVGKVSANETVTLDKAYKLYMYYASSTTDSNKVIVNSYDTYALAKDAMNKIDSKAYATAGIELNGTVIDADYAMVHMDRPGGNRVWNDNIIYIYENPADIYRGKKELTYVAGTWGVDAAFLEYNEQYRAYKLKISGVTGWVKMDNVTIVPVASYYGYTYKYPSNSPKVNITATEGIRMRKEHSVVSEMVCDLCYAAPGQTYTYYPEKTYIEPADSNNPDAVRYTWYYIKNGEYEGYIASENENWVKIVNTLLTDTFYYAYGNNLYHYIHMGLRHFDYSQIIGEAPFYYSSEKNKTYFLKNNANYCDHNTYSSIINRYISFDGNYFYTDYKDMIDDYRSGTYTRAINANNPYYAYFQYQPSRVKTGMTAETINQQILNTGVITSGLTHDVGYYYDANGNALHSLGTESILYNTGELFIKAANVYGVNPMSIYTAAMRESGYGKSAIALVKNNLFGYGANDATPFQSAYTYNSIYDSMVYYASQIGGSGGYANINDYRYFGTHKGNKQSGTFVHYMSDPYGGDKDTGAAYLADRNSGSVEMYSNTIGIKNSTDVVNIYSEPNQKSQIIYTTKNYATGYTLTNIPFIVSDKIYAYENDKYQGYYKVYTDLSLNENRQVDINSIYNFDYSYAYIKEEDLYVQNNQPVISANDIEIVQFETFDLLKDVKASDYEDGDLTSNIIMDGEVNTEEPGVYPIKYTVSDSSKFSSSKIINITVNPTKAPIIHAPEISIPQYTDFDPLEGINVTDNTDGDITKNIEIVSNLVKENILGTYTVIYKVTNSLDITTTKERKVNVINNEYPALNVENVTIYVNDSFDKQSIATAHDKEDGDLTNRIEVNGNVNTQSVGMYELTYSVKDNANQLTTKKIIITVENKAYSQKDNIFQLEELLYNERTQKVDFLGFIIMKDVDNSLNENISYSIIFENQYNNNRIIKKLTRLTSGQPYINTIENYSNEGAWFKESLDLSDLPTGNYNVYIRARNNDSETSITLRNTFFKEKVSSKFNIDGKGYHFRTNYFNKYLSIELLVREDGLVAEKNNPTIDNMYNPLYSMSLEGTNLNIIASSHNVGGDYGNNAKVERYMFFENIETNKTYLKTNVGFITDGPYKITLKVDDGYDKAKAWYKASIDLSKLPAGKYSIVVNTKTGEINDYGELYDIFNDYNISSNVGGKKITISRNTNIRYRIEVNIE